MNEFQDNLNVIRPLKDTRNNEAFQMRMDENMRWINEFRWLSHAV